MERHLSSPFIGLLVSASVAACGGHLPSRQTPTTVEPTGRPILPGLFGPTPSMAGFTTDFRGELPRSADFTGLHFTVTSAQVTNYHPYPILNHGPTPFIFGVLTVHVTNAADEMADYVFDEESFRLRTWSGDVLPEVPNLGARRFQNLDAGEEADDTLAFGLPDTSSLEGAVLLIGVPPDTPATIALTGAERPVDYPQALVAADRVHIGPIEWQVTKATLSLDQLDFDIPSVVSGDRANEGQVFVVLDLRGTVSGSQYGQASVTSDGITLLVDGAQIEPAEFRGTANVPEGDFEEFTLAFLGPSEFDEMKVQFTDTDGHVGTIQLLPGGA